MNKIKIELNKKFTLIPFNKCIAVSSDNISSNYYKWCENKEVIKNNSHGLFPKNDNEMESFFNDIKHNKILCFAIIDIKENIHIGNVTLQRFDWVNRSAELAIIIGETSYYGEGIGTLACKAIIEHGFNNLNLHRIWSGTSSTNIGMQKIFEKLKFLKEGEFIDAMFLNGKYVNIFEYGITKIRYENNIEKEEWKPIDPDEQLRNIKEGVKPKDKDYLNEASKYFPDVNM